MCFSPSSIRVHPPVVKCKSKTTPSSVEKRKGKEGDPQVLLQEGKITTPIKGVEDSKVVHKGM
jgi:hypothetical protein